MFDWIFYENQVLKCVHVLKVNCQPGIDRSTNMFALNDMLSIAVGASMVSWFPLFSIPRPMSGRAVNLFENFRIQKLNRDVMHSSLHNNKESRRVPTCEYIQELFDKSILAGWVDGNQMSANTATSVLQSRKHWTCELIMKLMNQKWKKEYGIIREKMIGLKDLWRKRVCGEKLASRGGKVSKHKKSRLSNASKNRSQDHERF